MVFEKDGCNFRSPRSSVLPVDNDRVELTTLPSWVTSGKYETEFERNLLISVYQRNITTFKTLLEQGVVDIHNYVSVIHTCMEMLCRRSGYIDFIKSFIAAGININAISKYTGLAAIHVAAISCNSSALEVLLSSEKTNVNRISVQGKTALHYIAEMELYSTEKEQAVKRCVDVLLKHKGIDVQRRSTTYSTLHGNVLHIAARSNNYVVVNALIDDGRIDVNAEDEYSWTPLHYAVRKRCRASDFSANKSCAYLLLKVPNIDINNETHRGTFNVTALHLAAAVGNSDVLELLLKDRRTKVGALDTRNRNALHYAAEQSSSVSRMVRKERFTVDSVVEDGEVNFNSPDFYEWIAINLAATRRNFTNVLVMLRDDINDSKLYADARESKVFRKRNLEFVDDFEESNRIRRCVSLLAYHPEIDVNGRASVGFSEKVTPFLLAAKSGNYVALEELIRNKRTDVNACDIDRRTALHYVVDQPDSEKVQRCIAILLNGPQKSSGDIDSRTPYKHDINVRDRHGNTALHLATKFNAQNSILTLLRHGGSIAQRGAMGSPVPYISAKVLETFLNECVASNEKLPEDKNFQLVLKYSFLTRNNISKLSPHNYPESDALYCMTSQNKKRRLLRHPVLRSFLHLKWNRVRSYFYMNVALHFIFVALINIFILKTLSFDTNHHMSFSTSKELSLNDTEGSTNSTHESSSNLNATFTSMKFFPDEEIILSALKFFTVVFLVKEFVQVIISPWRYCTNIDNYMEIFLLLFCCLDIYIIDTNRHLAAGTILLSWVQLVCLTGRFPSLSCQFEMLKKVAWTFIRFLAWYSFLLIAFALSFYVLFIRTHKSVRDVTCNCEENDDDSNDFFKNPGTSFLKTIVMMTGEFDAGDFPFSSAPVTSHVVFMIFVCFIAIVMLNLLNGLAVSDTQAIRQEAEVLSLVSRVRLVYYIESMVLGDPKTSHWMSKHVFRYLRHKCRILRILQNSISLFPHIVLEKKIWVLPNHQNRVLFTDPFHLSSNTFEVSYTYERSWCKYVTLDRDIIKSGMAIISINNHVTDMEIIKSSQCKISHALKEIDSNIKRMKNIVQEQNDNQKVLRKKGEQAVEKLTLKLESDIRDLEYKLYQKFHEVDKVNQENKVMLTNILQRMEKQNVLKEESDI